MPKLHNCRVVEPESNSNPPASKAHARFTAPGLTLTSFENAAFVRAHACLCAFVVGTWQYDSLSKL